MHRLLSYLDDFSVIFSQRWLSSDLGRDTFPVARRSRNVPKPFLNGGGVGSKGGPQSLSLPPGRFFAGVFPRVRFGRRITIATFDRLPRCCAIGTVAVRRAVPPAH